MKELTEGLDYYINADGYVVLTEKYHLEKGYCCGNGCRHCPYHFENVPEPKRRNIVLSDISATRLFCVQNTIQEVTCHKIRL